MRNSIFSKIVNCFIFLGILNTTGIIATASVPQFPKNRQLGNVKAQISEVKVIQEGKNTQGWSGFEERNSLATVTLRLIIYRNGKSRLNETMDVITRSRNIPKEFKVINLDGDKEPEILVANYIEIGAAIHANTYTRIYKYKPQTNSYIRVDHDWLNFGYKLKDLDKDGIPEFISSRRASGNCSCTVCCQIYPEIWQFRQGKMIDVTRQYSKLLRNNN
jgi:hypothetical protein